jgi:phospholipase C
MIVVSPWTKGGWVNSQTFDHTSVLRLLEARFGVAEPHITPWRRTVTGDLRSVFDFAGGAEPAAPVLPDASGLPARALAQAALPPPKPPAGAHGLPRQERGFRRARALPYAFDARMRRTPEALILTLDNSGRAGAGFALYPSHADAGGPWFYAVEAGKTLEDRLPADGPYDLTLHGPNGFLRRFKGGPDDLVEASQGYDAESGALMLTLTNLSRKPVTVRIRDAYAKSPPRRHALKPGYVSVDLLPIAASGRWYDLTVTVDEDPAFVRRLAGHVETGRPSRSDPALDRA